MKQFSIPKTCPICGKEYFIKTLECNGCHTKLEGKFAPGVFSNLDSEQTEFVLIFLKNHGNIQKVGKDLGISYPTRITSYNVCYTKLLRTIFYT